MKYFLLICLFTIFFFTESYSQYNWLQVQHPQQTWRYGQGTIEDAVLSVRPKGMFFQYDLYLTISARGLSFSSADSVEIQMYFSLPANAFVTDLWLWIDDVTIMRGLMLDVWTASSIYENIVKRRRDPAILTKYYGGYNLRIYPMAGDKYRKVKITYMVPIQFGMNNIYATLPTSIFNLGYNPPKGNKATILYWNDSTFSKPRIIEKNGIFESTPRIDTVTNKSYYYGTLSSSDFPKTLNFAVATPVDSNVYLSTAPSKLDTTNGYYQVAFKPSTLFNLNSTQKIAFLFEFDESRSSFTNVTILSQLKSFMLSQLGIKDSFNLIFSGAAIVRAKQSGWFSGDTASIENAFNSIGLNSVLNSDNMKALLLNGIDFAETNKGSSLYLIASSDKLGDYAQANPVINEIQGKLNPIIPIYVADISNWNVNYRYQNSKYYYGNDYFYENITRLSGGYVTSYRSTYSSNVQSYFQSVLENIRGTIQSFDFITRIENGFCSNRYSTNVPATGEIPIDRTVVQVGKYSGSFPFVIEIAGMYKGKTLTKKFSFSKNAIANSDSSLETIWASQYISSLEALSQTNNTIKSIVETSMQYRILSNYTAFLALEPNDTLKACLTCRDESKLVSVKDNKPLIPSSDSLLTAYPNPFNPTTTLKVRLPRGTHANSNTLQIFNILGQLIKTFDVSNLSDDKYSLITWDSKDNNGKTVSSGVYFAALTTSQGRFSIKLLLMK